MAKKLLVAASGTGGHIFPALAVAQELPDWDITWLGVPGRLEEQLIPQHYPLVTVPMKGLQGRPGVGWLKSLAPVPGIVLTVRGLLQNFQAVLTTGGYIAAPALLAARSLGLPALLHESNALPGKVTRVLARWCDGVGLGFAEAADYLPGAKTRWVGTPVRADCLAPSVLAGLSIPPDAQVIVVMGGSQGARGINELVAAAAPQWLARGLWVIHLTGIGASGLIDHPHYRAFPFWQQMGALLFRADLVISRAGAASLAELCATGRPSLLVPYPYATDDHQTYNARALVNRGAALMFSESALSAEILTRTVLALIDEPDTRRRMGESARSLARPQAASMMADWLLEIAHK